MTPDEIDAVCFKECTFNVLLCLRGVYVQAAQWGPLAHVEAIKILDRGDMCPFSDGDCDL